MGNRAVRADDVGYGIGQDRLQPAERGSAQKRIPLIDQIERRSNDKRDVERAAGNAV
jgi:hypothetical protein